MGFVRVLLPRELQHPFAHLRVAPQKFWQLTPNQLYHIVLFHVAHHPLQRRNCSAIRCDALVLNV
ncbi:MAG: phage tail assembly chaperone [Caldilineae bacterium]|nr:MAG: phage tail assembly chaperone [Caldilineae bacterium]